MTRRYTATLAIEYAVEFEAGDDAAAQLIAESCDPVNEGSVVCGPDIVDITSTPVE